jgi:hypothetical protein
LSCIILMIILMSFFKKENPSVYGQVLHSISLQNILVSVFY